MRPIHAILGRRLFLAVCTLALAVGVYAASVGGPAIHAASRVLCQNDVPTGRALALTTPARPAVRSSTPAAVAD